MENLSTMHKGNILIHIIAGSTALLIGIVILLASKGTRFHKKAGKWFLICLTIVILTGLLGVFVYGRNVFLLVITILSGYLGYSGYRAAHLKTNRPNLPDIAGAFASLFTVGYFLYYFHSIGLIWAPVIIYSTVGWLVAIVTYDLLRYFIPENVYAGLWLQEHILKMVSAFSGLLSAFSGTVFPQYQPYSQFLPSVFGTLIAIGFMLNVYIIRRKSVSLARQGLL